MLITSLLDVSTTVRVQFQYFLFPNLSELCLYNSLAKSTCTSDAKTFVCQEAGLKQQLTDYAAVYAPWNNVLLFHRGIAMVRYCHGDTGHAYEHFLLAMALLLHALSIYIYIITSRSIVLLC